MTSKLLVSPRAALLPVVFALLVAPACASAWTITDLGTLGGSYSVATDINDLGQVVGYSEMPPHLHNGVDMVSFAHGFISAPQGGALTDLGPSVDDNSNALGVNNSGQVVGYADLGGSLTVAYVSGPNGAPLPGGPVSPPYAGSINGASFLIAKDINNSGQIIGYDVFGYNSFITKSDGVTLTNLPYNQLARLNDAGQVVYTGFDSQAYIWSETAGARALVPASASSTAVDINNAGQVVGQMDSIGYITAPNGGALTMLGTLGGSFSAPSGINDLGQVIGMSETADGQVHAFITGPNGELIDLSTLDAIIKAGWTNITVAAINDAGQIAGTGTIDGKQHAFFLSPVPEPASAVLLLIGLTMLGCRSFFTNVFAKRNLRAEHRHRFVPVTPI